MFSQLKERRIDVEDDIIQVYELPEVAGKRIYTFVYTNKDTRQMDLTFGLNGNAIAKNSQEYRDLMKSTGHGSLGLSEAEFVLRYFATIAAQGGRFIGLREDEIRRCLQSSKSMVNLSDLETTLNHRDALAGGVNYLKRIDVEGTKVILPVNLRKAFF